jgi:hypothetical protein
METLFFCYDTMSTSYILPIYVHENVEGGWFNDENEFSG